MDAELGSLDAPQMPKIGALWGCCVAVAIWRSLHTYKSTCLTVLVVVE